MMRQLFERKDRPLYGSAVPIRLGRLADRDIGEYVSGRFDATGRQAGEALGPLLQMAKGHPQRAMLLAHRLWENVAQNERASLDDWHRALAQARGELGPEFDAQWRGLSTSEQKTMRSIIAGDGSPYRGNALERLELTKDMVRRALPRLGATGEIEDADGKHAIVDPMFADWIERLNEAIVICSADR
jgi:hypothetical protein